MREAVISNRRAAEVRLLGWEAAVIYKSVYNREREQTLRNAIHDVRVGSRGDPGAVFEPFIRMESESSAIQLQRRKASPSRALNMVFSLEESG